MIEWSAEDTPFSLSFSKDGSMLACGHYSGTATVAEARTGSVQAQWDANKSRITRTPEVRFAPNGQIVTTFHNGVSIWDRNGQPVVRELPVPHSSMTQLGSEFLPDGRLLVSCGFQTTAFSMSTFDPADWSRLETYRLAPALTSPGLFAVEPGGTRIASAYGPVFDLDGRTTTNWKSRIMWPGNVECLAWCPGQDTVAFATDQYGIGGVGVVNIGRGRRRWLLRPRKALGEFLTIAFTPDGATMLTGGEQGLIRFTDTSCWAERAALDFAAGWVHAIAVSPDGLTAAAACGTRWEGGGKVVVWDLQ